MEKIDYLDAQARLAKTMRQVCQENQPVTIDGIGKDRVVMMPLATFDQLKEVPLNWSQEPLKQRQKP